MADVKISRGLQANYDAIEEKDADMLYICLDTGNSYLGELLLGSNAETDLYWEEM